jgi:uncharacterized membrane protein
MQLSKLNTLKQKSEPTWHITLAIAIAVGLQFILKDSLVLGSKYAIASLEVSLMLVLLIPELNATIKRLFAFLLITLITIANVVSLGQVTRALFAITHIDGKALLVSSVAIYLTNIIVFGILYWELDNTKQDVPDFEFPQFSSNESTKWRPTYFDYLYVSITNATAFSPTDTLPLTHRAKALMSVQSIIALVTVVLVTARAVNILG